MGNRSFIESMSNKQPSPRASSGGERGSRLLRALDRGIGIPLIATLGLLHPTQRSLPRSINSIGVLETAAIGDTTLLSAVLLDLRAAYPSAHITLFAGATNIAVARLLNGPDEVISLPIKHVVAARRVVRSRHFDLFLDYGPWPRINGVITHFADADFKVGFNTPGQFRHYVYDRSVPHSRTQHELENFRDMLRLIGVPVTHAPRFPASVGSGELPEPYRASGQYVVFHMWPGGYRSHLKEWPAERWLQLGKSMSALGLEILLTGAPSERDKNEAMVARAAREGVDPGWRNCAGATIDQTIAILRRARLTVSVNTGVMHLAAVAGVPVIGLHGPTSARRWGPVGARARAISAPGEDCGYLNLGFEYPFHCTCMERITVEQVVAECRDLVRAESASTAAGH
jgi:heptosyltransferase I